MSFGTAFIGTASFLAPVYPIPAAESPQAKQVLEEVVVTATRRAVPLHHVPLSVHAITAEHLAMTGARNFRDYANAVPGVIFNDVGGADAKVTIRGISTDVFSEIRPLTATYLDEIPVTHPGTHQIVQSDANPELVDVERIEVLRGPQGTLYGASSMGGTLRIVTRKPDPERASVNAETVLSSTEHGGFNYELDAVSNMPLGAASALRVVGYYRDADGFIDNIGTGRSNANSAETFGSRLAFSEEFGDRLRMLATLSHQEHHADGLNIHNVVLPDYQQRTLIDESYDDEWTLPSLLLTYDLGWAEFLSSTAWIDRKWRAIGDVSGFNDFLGQEFGFDEIDPITADHVQEFGEFVQEFRIASSRATGISWLAGLFLNDRDQRWLSSFPAPGFDAKSDSAAADAGAPDNIGIGRVDFDHRQVAAFGEIGVPLGTRWRADIGTRLYRIDERSHGSSVGILGSGGVTTTRRAHDSGVAPRFTLTWRPDDTKLLYATGALGFRPSGPNAAAIPETCAEDLASAGIAQAPTAYRSDSLWNYELGGRATWFDRRLQASAAAYHMDWSDVQIFLFLPCGTGLVLNATEAASDGVEFEVTSSPSASLEFKLGGSYIEANLTQEVPFVDAPAGSPLPGVAQLNWQGSAIYRFRVGDDSVAFVRTAIRHVDESFSSFVPPGIPRLRSPAYEIIDLRIGLEGQNWSVAIFADNVLDEYGIVNAVEDFGLHPAGDWHNLVRPRTIGLNIRANFD